MKRSRKPPDLALSETQQAALDAVRFCLLNGTQPFRTDIQILVDLIDGMNPQHPYGD